MRICNCIMIISGRTNIVSTERTVEIEETNVQGRICYGWLILVFFLSHQDLDKIF